MTRRRSVAAQGVAIRHSLTLWGGSRRFARAYAALLLLSAASPASRRRTGSRSPAFASMMLLAMASRTAVGWGVWPSRAHAMSKACPSVRVASGSNAAHENARGEGPQERSEGFPKRPGSQGAGLVAAIVAKAGIAEIGPLFWSH